MSNFNYQLLNQFSDAIRTIYPRMPLKTDFRLSALQMGYLHFILDHDGCCQQDLVAIGIGSKSAISEMLSSLEEQGLITRERNKSNHRKFDIHLTEAGLEIATTIKNTYIQFCNQCMDTFTPEEKKTFEKLILKFVSNRPDTV